MEVIHHPRSQRRMRQWWLMLSHHSQGNNIIPGSGSLKSSVRQYRPNKTQTSDRNAKFVPSRIQTLGCISKLKGTQTASVVLALEAWKKQQQLNLLSSPLRSSTFHTQFSDQCVGNVWLARALYASYYCTWRAKLTADLNHTDLERTTGLNQLSVNSGAVQRVLSLPTGRSCTANEQKYSTICVAIGSTSIHDCIRLHSNIVHGYSLLVHYWLQIDFAG